MAISLSGGLQCVLLSLSFLLLKKGNTFSHRLVAALMFLVGLRLFKSAWYVHAGDHMPLFWINIGFAAHLAAGPLLVQSIRTAIRSKTYSWTWNLLPYSKAPVIYALALFPLSISAWRSYDLLTLPKRQPLLQKYQNIEIPAKTLQFYRKKIMTFIEAEKPYLQGGYTMKQFSDALDIPSHIISWVLNQHLQSNFTSLLNQHRIESACRLLDDVNDDHYSIAGIAFDASFNSLSVFNQNFKRRKGVTPSAYRKKA